MKIADIKLGETYRTMVSGALVEVIVNQRIEPTRPRERVRFRVKRADNGKMLTSRDASALRPVATLDPVTRALLEQVDAARLLERTGKWSAAVAAWNALARTAEAAGRFKMAAFAKHCAERVPAKAATDSETAK